jgi:hypothetical protein
MARTLKSVASYRWVKPLQYSTHSICITISQIPPGHELLAKILIDIYFFGSIISAILLLITLFIFSYFR